MIGNYLTNTFFMIIILLILWMRSSAGIRRGPSLRRLRDLIAATGAYVLMDAAFIACDLAESCSDMLFSITVFVFYIIYVLLPFVWYQFVRNFVGSSFRPIFHKLEVIPFALLIILVILSPFTGILWSIEAGCTYVRGPLFTFFSFFNYFYYILPFIYAIVICIRKQRKKEPYLFQALAISLAPLVAAAVNNLVIPIYEIFPFQPFVSVLVTLMGYFFMAAKENDAISAEQQQVISDALQKANIAQQHAVEASKVKSKFLSNMSHDIRTPMNAIINLTELAKKSDDINVIKDYLSKMSVSESFLLTLINDILDMSKIESGEVTFNKEPLTRAEFLNTVDTVIEPLMSEKHINFHSELRPGQYTISVDKMRFNQIFFNLLSNAVKFTPEGGDVWFEVDNLEVADDILEIQFVIRDTGIGMSEDFLKHLYEPFAREHSQLNSSTRGTGLGLAIVKNLVEAMDGTISVKSELGKGTEFTVKFPVQILSKDDGSFQSTKQNEAEDKENIEGLNILLVEDNEINTYVAKVILEEAGCTVVTAENGREALDTFNASEPYSFDAILMDVRMPIMDGIEATKAIRRTARADSASIPIIAMTADAFEEERKQTLESGMNYHLSKPINAAQLYKVLNECTKSSHPEVKL